MSNELPSGNDFQSWIESQPTQEGEVRNVISGYNIVVKQLNGTVIREYYESDTDPNGSKFKEAGRLKFFPDHTPEIPHLELETRLSDKGFPDIVQKLTIDKGAASYERREKGAVLDVEFEMGNTNSVGFNRANLIRSAGFFGSASRQGLHMDVDAQDRRASNAEANFADAPEERENRTEGMGTYQKVEFFSYTDNILNKRAVVMTGRFGRLLSSAIPDQLLQNPSAPTAEYDKWKSVDLSAIGTIIPS